MKKFFLVSLILFVLTLIFWGVYMLAFRHNTSNPSVNQEITPTIQKTESKEPVSGEVIQELVAEGAKNPFLDREKNVLSYIVPQSSEIKQINLDTSATQSVMALSYTPSRAVWSPNGAKALVEERNDQGVRWYLIDISEKKETQLKSGIESPTWTALGDRIVYKYYDAARKERSLNVANPDGSGWRKIGDSPFPIMESAFIPQSTFIAYWNRGNALEVTSLQDISLTSGEVRKRFSEKFGADYRFSPNGEHILASHTDRQGGSGMVLALLNKDATQYQNLLIPTIVSKTVWSKDNKTIYYALPGSLPDGSVMPNDYYSKHLLTQDTFWKVDISTGEKTRLVDPKDITKRYDASNLLLDADETHLLFIDRSDEKVYRVRL